MNIFEERKGFKKFVYSIKVSAYCSVEDYFNNNNNKISERDIVYACVIEYHITNTVDNHIESVMDEKKLLI